MGKRGPAPAPTPLKVVRGDRESRINRDEPVPGELECAAPGWLSDDALAVWDGLAPDLLAKKVLTAWDAEAFAIYCNAVVRVREAEKSIGADGLTVSGSMGGVVKNPAVTAMKDYAELVKSLGAKFGLTPSDRSQLSVKGDADAKSEAERLFG